MGDESGVLELIKELKQTRDKIEQADAERTRVIDELVKKASSDTEAKLTRVVTDLAGFEVKHQALKHEIDNLMKRVQRPGGGGGEPPAMDKDRANALGLLEYKHQNAVPKRDQMHPFQPTDEQVAEAQVAIQATKAWLHTTDATMLSPEHRKALSSFTFGSSGFILPPEMSNRILSCLIYPTDIAGLMDNMTISGPSIKFMIDNVILDQAAWACETNCFANNPQAQLNEGLGELEIKPETLRYILCTTRDLLEDAATNLEAWMLQKVQRAFGITINNAIINGTGQGMPMGILNPAAGIPILETSDATPAGQFTWQDLFMLKWSVPMQYHGANASYFMNQMTLALALTMSDAIGRPMLLSDPREGGGMTIAGSPVHVVTQMPNVAPGAEPVAFGAWKEVYMVVNRKSVTAQQDPYSAGFCVLWKWEARVGGNVICPNAARILRIR